MRSMIVGGALLALSACASGQSYPDEAAARSYLSLLTSVTESGNAELICSTSAVSRAACLSTLELAGDEAPKTSPRVVCSWVYEDRYRVMAVEGKAASGRPFINHLWLTTQGVGDSDTMAVQPVYWINNRPPGTDESQDWKPEAVCR